MTFRGWFSGPDSGAMVLALGELGMLSVEGLVSEGSVHVVRSDCDGDVVALADRLAEVPFEVAGFATLHESWPREPGYEAPVFPGAPFALGWGLALRGEGHSRLVSRRWIDDCPVRVVRALHDTTVVQFHDLDADAGVAAEQARPGHERFSTGPKGGGLQAKDLYEFTHGLKGGYLPPLRMLRVIVTRPELSAEELRDAAATRLVQPFGPGLPIDNVMFVFADEDHLQHNLPALWLHGFVVHRIEGGVESRVDESATPPVRERPAWVKLLGRDDRR